MFNAVIRFSLQHRSLIVVACLVALGYGAYLTATMPIDVFPDLNRPRVTVMTECPGLAAEEVETLVTFPIESAVLGANGVLDVRTQSAAGLSSVVVEFDWGMDILAARQIVQERLATIAGDLPEDVRPQMAPPGAIMGQIVLAGLRRSVGPSGGDLVPVPNTSHLAERVRKPDGTLQLLAWKPTDRRDPASWTPVTVTGATWSAPDREGDQSARATVGGELVTLVFPSELKRQLALRTLADWVVRPRLLKITGVAQVLTVGGGRKQYQVLVDQFALHEYELTLQDVEEALKANNVNMTGGFATDGGVEKSIRVIGRIGTRPERVIEELKQIPVKTDVPRTVVLGQVARVAELPQVKRGDASVNGDPGVIITVVKQPHADTRAVTAAVQAALLEVEPSLPGDVIADPDLYRLRDFIDRGVYNVGEALVIGAILVLIVLFLFLLNFRTTFITLTAIPLSLAVTAIVFRLVGALAGVELSINIMTLGGIAVAMGELVDDAIVDVENIFRRLRENSHSPVPKPALRVVYEASAEIRSSIVFGTAVVILVFLPLFALSGIEGRLFAPLGIAYVVSILASLLVSLTLTPVLGYYLLANSKAVQRDRDGLLVRGLKWVAARMVRFSMKHAGMLLLVAWVLVAYGAWRLTTIGADFLPAFDEGTVQVNVMLPAGASVEASNQVSAVTDRVLKRFKKSPDNPKGEVMTFGRRTGRSENDEHADPPSDSVFFVTINPDCGKSREEVLKLLQDAIKAEVVGAEVEVEQPLSHMISHLISGTTAQIAIKVYGDDINVLEKIAKDIRNAAAGVEGVSSLVVEPIAVVDEIHIKLKPDALAFYGVSRAYVGQFVQTALQGAVVSQVIEGQRRFDLVVRLDEPHRSDIANLGHLHIDLPDNRGHIHLDQVADITPLTGGDAGANQVKRENMRRRIVVRCNAQGRDLAGVVTDIRAAVDAKVAMPEGYFVEYGGQFESQRRATRLIAVLAVISVLGMFFVLTLLFPSARIVLQILNAIPTAFIGGVLALVITGQTLTVASLVGFISLGGIAVRNGILLITHYIHLMRHEGEGFTEKMVLRGSLERLSPVLMTALTAGIALIPLVLAGHQPGREILYPVATVILGGLITSTLCEFLIHPGLFWRFSGKDAEQLAARRHDEGLGEKSEIVGGAGA
jgi:HME family heavy-metal exporter